MSQLKLMSECLFLQLLGLRQIITFLELHTLKVTW